MARRPIRLAALLLVLAAAAAAPQGPGPDQEPKPPAAGESSRTPPDRFEPAPAGVAEPPANDPAQPAPVDEVQKAQAPAPVVADPKPPAARVAPAAAGAPLGGLPAPDRLPMGGSSVALSVEVQAPATINLHQPTTVAIVVKNTGTAEAAGVVVHDLLPDGLEVLETRPEAQPAGRVLTWTLGALAPGAEKVVTIKGKATKKVALLEHAAIATLSGGSRARTLVKEPRLKVEQTVSAARELKGRQLLFNITVTNIGNGPARNVVVQARLSDGLLYEKARSQVLELPFKDVLGRDAIAPGEEVPLELIVDTVAGGEQTCQVVATSPDVPLPDPGATAVQKVTIVEPKLVLSFTGSAKRPADTPARYKLTLSNPGTAPARNVQAAAFLPMGVTLQDKGGGRYIPQKRQLLWTVPQLEPGQKREFLFQVLVGGPRPYRFDALANAAGIARIDGSVTTEVLGTPDVQFTIAGQRKVLDVREVAEYEIQVVNKGLADATNLQFSADLSPQLEAVDIDGEIEGNGQATDPTKRRMIFPLIRRLAAKEKKTLVLRVKALKSGQATCQLGLTYDGLDGNRIIRTAVTYITDAAEPGG